MRRPNRLWPRVGGSKTRQSPPSTSTTVCTDFVVHKEGGSNEVGRGTMRRPRPREAGPGRRPVPMNSYCFREIPAGVGGRGTGGRAAVSSLAQCPGELVEGVHVPVRALHHSAAHLAAAVADEGVGAALDVARLHVRRAVTHHDHLAEAVFLLQVDDGVGLATGTRGEFVRAVAAEGAILVVEEGVRIDIGARYADLVSDGLNHLTEAARDQEDAHTALAKQRDALVHAW
mmetsp:Transcript_23953/g.51659  ORF Transcript_23953/g.51659 Transcript_23953/m.51659 type:complete len:230 (-) Transcript_23953:962-1651(-)